MILETYLNENRLLEVNQIEFDKMINENTYYLTEGFTNTIKSIGNKIWEAIKKLFQKIIDGLKWIKSKTIDKIINFFKPFRSSCSCLKHFFIQCRDLSILFFVCCPSRFFSAII